MDALCVRWNAFSGDSDTVTLRLAGLYAQLHAFAVAVLQLHNSRAPSLSPPNPVLLGVELSPSNPQDFPPLIALSVSNSGLRAWSSNPWLLTFNTLVNFTWTWRCRQTTP